ncbi:MAG: gamma-glutamyl-gamma-aminobutyrate hydrolase family protein [Lachnospiraceae bacterium]|nr:gamma-glutamyl-gamma-aminobutyrate hydrolase family protein [Lachnospiraceae bacterium]
MKTVIYTQRVEVVEAYQERRDCADQRIADFIYACGFLPIPVPNKSDLAEAIIQELQPAGIILTGGNSLVMYGGNAPERDSMDSALIELAIQNRIPLYGFCRGMQSILSYFGNDLTNVEGHVAVRHTVIAKDDSYEVNSYHNQACVKLKDGCGLLATAWTEDGVIEAIRHENLPIVGTMWHPEREEVFTSRDIEKVGKFMHV